MVTFQDFDGCLERIKMLYQWEVDRNKGLVEENKYLKEGQYKDKELKRMAEELTATKAAALQGFAISPEQTQALQEYRKNHVNAYHNGKEPAGVSGGNWIYEFIPTSIGVVAHCYCGACRNKAIKAVERSGKSIVDNADSFNLQMSITDASLDFSEF